MWRRLASPRLPSTTSRAWASTKPKARPKKGTSGSQSSNALTSPPARPSRQPAPPAPIAQPTKSTAKAKAAARARKADSESIFEDAPAPAPPSAGSRKAPPPALIPPQRGFDGQRITRIVVMFAAGFSIYFFLEDPSVVPARPKPAHIPPNQYVPTKLVSTESCGPDSDTKLLKIAAPPHLYPRKDAGEAENEAGTFDPVWSVFIKDDDIQVERAYTPLDGVDAEGNILFWIKKYPKGEVGRWLHSKVEGDTIEVRGPLKTWPWKEDAWDEVVMISGGTGITPFVQLFNKVIKKSSPDSKTRFTLLHSSRIPSELPPPIILDPMVSFAAEYPERFNLHVFVDEDDGSKSGAQVPTKLIGRISEGALKKCIGVEDQPVASSSSWWGSRSQSKEQAPEEPKKRVMLLVCGPEAMIGAIAGPYGRNLSQGPVGGILGKMGYTSSEVYKL